MIAAMLLMFAQGFGSNAADIRGEWINQRSTAIVRIEDCPSGVCGTVIWSAPTARRDAAGGGIGELNGTIVMLGFVPASTRRWRGRLFLPDHNRTVQATIELRINDELQVTGCELGGLLCKRQRWHRRSAE
jgi:uncharacterized protein (DUF2147 family)